MNFKEYSIKTIEPKAVLKGGLNGSRFIARVVFEDGSRKLFSILPPDYTYDSFLEIENYILDASVAKYGYQIIEGLIFSSDEGYDSFLKKINES